MQSVQNTSFLRWVLFADAATCIFSGMFMVFGANTMEALFGLPVKLLQIAGAGLFPFGAFLIYLGTRSLVSIHSVWIVIVLNVLWTIDSFLLLLTDWIAPSSLGYAFVIFQAVGVAIFAALEYVALKKTVLARNGYSGQNA